MKTQDFNEATRIVAKHIETLGDRKSVLNSMTDAAMRHAGIVEKLLSQGGTARPVQKLEHHLLGDSLKQWVTDDLLSGSGPKEVVKELAETALESVDWLALAEKCLTRTAPPNAVSKAA